MQRIDPYINVTKGILDIYYYLDKIKYKINQGGRLMEKRDNNTILSKFISKEVEVIYEKYRNITEDEINLVAKFIRKLEVNKVDFYDPYLDYKSTKALAEDLAGEENIDVSKLYIFLKSDLKLKVELEAVRKHYEDLKDKGYKQIDKYLLYYDYGEDILRSRAEDVWIGIGLFVKKQLVKDRILAK